MTDAYWSQGCCLICAMVILFAGSTTSMRAIRSD